MMPPEKLKEILHDHDKWLSGDGGSRAVLSGAVLSGSDLRGAVLRDADLRGAVLSGSDLRGTDLRDADLRRAVLRGSDLRGAVLRDAVLSDAVLSGSDLRGADLRRAVLRRAVLSDAVLSGGKFVARSAVQFSAHGEMGRELSAIKTDAKENAVTLYCGCFSGPPEELRDFIAKGKEEYIRTRTLALDTVLMLLEVTP